MTSKYLIIFLIFILKINMNGQTINGKILDFQTSEQLSYVHIGIIGKNMGTISREDGTFEIALDKSDKNDTLAFSMIGYEIKKLALKELKNEHLAVQLHPMNYDLSLITVASSKLVKKSNRKKKIGAKRFISTMTGGSGLGWGGEVGIKISNGGNLYKATQINFRLNEISYDSLLFRVNFYTIKNDTPSTSILTKELFVKGYYREEWVSENIENENIFFDEDVIVSLETVKGWNSRERGYSMFFKKRILYTSKVYLKKSSMDTWHYGEDPKIALNLEVEKYKRKK